MREISKVLDDGWKRVWAEMTDAELEDRLFTYLWLARKTINPHANRVAQAPPDFPQYYGPLSLGAR